MTPTIAPLLSALLLAAPPSGSVKERVEALLRSPGFENGQWGLLVVEARSGEVVYERDADRLFCPASVTKLFSTAAAWIDLGPEHRFRTPVVRRGEIDGAGTLRGDLILVGQGDPNLGGRGGPGGTLRYEDNDHSYAGGHFKSTLVPSDPLAGLDHLARAVRDAGVRSISGDVVVDDRLFEPAPSTGSGPSRVSPVVVNDNLIDVVAVPAERPGQPARVRMVPETGFAAMDAQVETAPEGVKPVLEVRPVGPRRFAVRGRLPVGHKPAVKYFEVEEPAAFARALLVEALARRGVRAEASPLGDNPGDRLPPRDEVARLPRLGEWASAPLREEVKVVLKVSQNLHASTLPLLIAAHHGERSLSAGLKRQGDLLKGLGVDVGAISFGGGAGGDRADLVSPRATVALLRGLSARPDFAAYEAGLPVLGRDGTLSTAIPADSPARGQVRAKTGTYWVVNGLSGQGVLTSKALAGTIRTASGRTLLFAFFVNHVPLRAPADDVSDATAAAGKLLGRLCETFHDDRTETAARGR